MPFEIALSGINAASSDLEVTANNIANVNTVGFKGSRAEFSQVYSVAGENLSANAAGSGVRLTNIAQQFSDGNLTQTGNSYDFGLSGAGFFTIRDGAGYSYTRAGNFHPDDQGNIVTATGQFVQAYPPSAAGGFDISALTDLKITSGSSPAKASTKVSLTANLSANATAPTGGAFDPTNDQTYNYLSTFQSYDSLGATHTTNIYYVKDATNPNTWNAYMTMDGTQVGTAQPIAFSSGGAIVTPANGQLTFGAVSPNPGAAPLNVTVDVSKITQFGDSYATTAAPTDGYAAGKFSKIDVAKDGTVSAIYSNGVSTPLGQLAIATFANNQGLRQLNDTNWVPSSESGQPIRGVANSGDVGTVQAGQLEASNTADLTAQLVNMIKAQRNYQANAQVISTDDKLTQTIINIRN
ncbi:flagellar hook protein FlgE [Luteibacter jiangsuensis]|uniref:Flagellar hook protein FlgE n=1 Tax=Luteibacter jiangsuensis TaxID=637577 RepID=A0ABX0Q447_9GAMM|nr:flagellar hook protein FlgE [Luteibacter jiangsuensis]NID03973.1 flagellar hook protein FlgE [Luteibacter jiangsuensis]